MSNESIHQISNQYFQAQRKKAWKNDLTDKQREREGREGHKLSECCKTNTPQVTVSQIYIQLSVCYFPFLMH